MNPEITCTVCQTVFTGRYCPTCGQQAKRKTVTLWSIISDMVTNIFSLEKSVFASILKLIANPNKLIDNYSQGFRGYYPTPGKMLFYALAIAALHITYINSELLGLTLDIENVQAQLMFWIIFLPLLALTSHLSFLRSKQGFTKHVISLTYLGSSFFMVLTFANDLLITLGVIESSANPFALFLILVLSWNARVFTPPGKPLKLLIHILFEIVVFAAIVATLVGLAYLNDPNSINLG